MSAKKHAAIFTPSQTSGPLFGFSLMQEGAEATRTAEDSDAWQVEGQVMDGAGVPIAAEVFLEFWAGTQFARVRTKPDGVFRVVIGKPQPIQRRDGRVFAPHFNVAIFGRGLTKHLVTRMYFPDETAANDGDPILERVQPERRHTLVARPGNETRHLRFDVHLQGNGETVFFELA